MSQDIILNTELRIDESKLRQSVDRLERQMRFKGPFASMASDVSRFDHELNRATQRVITLGTAFQLLGTAVRTIRDVANSTVQVEKALTDINSVFRLTNQSLSNFSSSLFDIARETAKSFDEVAKAGAEFARQGLSVQKTQEAVRAAMILSRDANIDAAVSVRALTAAVNSFQREGLGYSQVINKLAAADSAFAVSSEDLQNALIRVGSAASDAGVSFNELIALVTSAQQITARGGSVIAGALNTIFTRINRRDTLDALEALGVAISDTQGRMLPTLNVLQNFAKAYDRMTGSVKNQAAELVGGVRQLNTLKAVLDDLSRSNSVFAQSLHEVENAHDAAERRNAARNQSLSARMTQLQETGRQIGSNIGTLGFEGKAKGVLSMLNNNPISDALRSAGNLEDESLGAEAGRTFIKGFGNAVTFGLAPVLAAVMFKVSKRVFSNLIDDVRSLTTVNGLAQEHANIEKQIIALYEQGGASLQKQLAAMTSLTQQAAIFSRLMSSSQAGAEYSQASAIASIIMAQRSKTPRAASGYIPMGEESSAISRGVGGAPVGARPVYLPNFNRGGGQMGIVANTSEFIVPNLAGGSAIYNRTMIQKYGLPPGSVPVAAEGYIPHAAGGGLFGYQDLRPTPGSGGGFYIRREDVDTFNRLFVNLSKAATVIEASKFASQVSELSKSLDTASKSRVLKELSIEMKKFGQMSSLYSGSASAAMLSGPNALSSVMFPNLYTGSKNPIMYSSASALAAANTAISPLAGLGILGGPNIFSTFAANRAIAPQTSALMANAAIAQQASVFAANQSLAGRSLIYDPFMIPGVIGSGRKPLGLNYGAPRPPEPVPYRVETIGPPVPDELLSNHYYTAPSLREKQRAIRARAAAEAAAEQQAMLAITNPSLRDRVAARLSGPMGTAGAMGLAMGLPFIGGNIDQRPGGTSEGMMRGALSSGLNFAGFGASVGMMTGNPFGPLIGAGAGALLGGFIGALGKITQSFEELTAELDQSKKKMVESYEKASQFLRLQEELEAAKSSGQNARALDISRQQVQLLAAMPQDVRTEALSLKNNPERMSLIAQRSSKAFMSEDAKAGFLSAISKIASEDFESKEGKNIIGQGLTSVMSAMTPSSLKTLESKMNSGDLMGALEMLATVVGVDKKKLKDIKFSRTLQGVMGPIAGSGGYAGTAVDTEVKKMLGPAMMSAFGDVNSIINAQRANAEPSGLSLERIAQILSLYRSGARSVSIQNSAATQLMQAQQQQILAAPMTERMRLFRSGQLELQSVSEKARLGRSSALAEGKSSIAEALVAGGVRREEAFAEVGQLTGRDSVMSLLNKIRGGKSGGIFTSVQSENIQKSLITLLEKYQEINKEEEVGLELTKQINAIKKEMFESERDYKQVAMRLFAASKDEAEKAMATSRAAATLINTPGISGSLIESGLMGGATTMGSLGNARGSFVGGFQARFAGLKRDMLQFAEIGNRVAQSLESNLGNAFGDFVTGANSAKNAFRSFAISVLSDTSRMFASKAFQSILSSIPGFTPAGATGGEFTGSGFRFAGGGAVPALLTGGEFYISPRAAKRIGYDTLRQINRYADGGVVRGGSGVKDDVPARLPPGSFIVRKSATQRLGSDYLQSLVDGHVQGRFLGGFLGMPMLYGALLGGGLGALAGGKKGALIGAGIGAIGGGLYGMHGAPVSASPNQTLLNVSSPSPDLASVAAETPTMMSPFTVSASRTASIMSSAPWWKTAAYGLGAAGLLGVAAQAFSPKGAPGPISAAQVPAFRSALESQQSQMFSSNRYAYLTVNPQGGYSLGSFGPEIATRRWADGGAVSSGVELATIPGPRGDGAASNAPQVSVKIEINNNGQVSSKSSSSGDQGPFGSDFGQKIEKVVRPIVQDELVRQSRSDGFFSQKSRYVNNS